MSTIGVKPAGPFNMGTAVKVIIAVIILMMVCGLPVAAADVREINSTSVFRNLIEEGDFLLVFHYTLTHDAEPEYPANRYYHFRLMDETGEAQLGATAPYPYYSNGYGEGVGGFYFAPEDAPEWEAAHVFRLEGNPELHDPPPDPVVYTLTISDYSQLESQEENQTLLGNYIVDLANSLELDWEIKMVTSTDLGIVLSETGETYFRGTMPGIAYMAPQIFALQTGMPEAEFREWGTGTADAARGRYEGTWIGDAMSSMGDFLGVEWQIVTGLIVLIAAMALFAISHWRFKTAIPGYVGALVLMLMGFLMGWISPAIMGVAALLAAMYFGYILVFRHG